jgi:NADPH2:quinone reductase
MTMTTTMTTSATYLAACYDDEAPDDASRPHRHGLNFVSNQPLRELLHTQVRIRVAYTDVNPVDVQKLQQHHKQVLKQKHHDSIDLPSPLPLFVVGYGGSGYIDVIGDNVPTSSAFQKGQAVAFLGDASQRIGSYGTHVLLDYRLVAPMSMSMPMSMFPADNKVKEEDQEAIMEAAACIGVAGNTAYEALEKVGLSLSESQSSTQANTASINKTLLVVGGAGGVGSWTTRLARAMHPNLNIVVTASTPDDAATQHWCVSQNGATQVIGHSDIGDSAKSNLQGGREGSVDHIVCLAEPTTSLMSAMADVLKPFGKMCLVVAGPSISNVDLGFVFFKSGTVAMQTVFSNARNGFTAPHINQSAQMAHILELMMTTKENKTKMTAPLRPDRHSIPGCSDWTRALDNNGVLDVMLANTSNDSTKVASDDNEKRQRHYGKLVMKITSC